MQEDDKENISSEEKGKKGRPKGSKNKRKRGRPKTKKKSYYKPKPKIKEETDLSNVQLPEYELPTIKQYKDRENLVIPETLEAIPTSEKKAPKHTQDNLLDSLLDENKLNEESLRKDHKEINQEPVDPSFYYRGSKNIPVAGAEYAFTADMVEELRKCKEDIIYFAENFFYVITLDKGKQKIKLYDAQKRMLLNMVNNRFSANLACRQAGKALALNTPIYTKEGWKTMGELTTKDKVLGTDGKFIKITHAHEILYNRECYKIIFEDEIIVADAEHQWFVQSNIDFIGSIKTTSELLAEMEKGVLFKIPACKQIQKDKKFEFHSIKSIEKQESIPVRCITVDSEDSLYLAGNTFIPTHNSTLLTVFVLWMTNFNSDYRAAIVANKESTAINIFKRIRMAYEQLPNYIKAGVKDYAKTGMTLENDSSIIVSTTTATSIRGDTLNCISGDSLITYKTYKDEGVTLSIKELYEKFTESVIEDGNSFAKLNLNGHILTDRGWSDFFAVKKSIIDCEGIEIVTETGKSINTTLDHLIFFDEKNFKAAKEYKVGDVIFTLNGKEKIKNIQTLEKQTREWFDIVQTEDKTFIANDIKIHNCICLDEAAFIEGHILEEFWSSVIPSISSGKKSKILVVSTPNSTNNKFYEIFSGAENGTLPDWKASRIDWWDVPGRDEEWKRTMVAALGSEEKFAQEFGNTFLDNNTAAVGSLIIEKFKREKKDPVWVSEDGEYTVFEFPAKGRLYAIGVDVGEGIGRAASVAQVLDVTDLTDIRQVAIFSSTITEPYHFANKLNTIGNSWGLAPILIERNNCGAQVIDALHYKHTYQKIVSYNKISESEKYNRTRNMGVLSHNNIRFDGVQNMRYWINHLQCVKINDPSTISEFETFVRHPNGVFRKRTENFFDDRIMALVWALFILDPEICEQYYTIEEYDAQHKPLKITSNGYWEESNENFELKDLKKDSRVISKPKDESLGVSMTDLYEMDKYDLDVDSLKDMGYDFFNFNDPNV